MLSSTTNSLKEKSDEWAFCGFVELDNNKNVIGFLIYTVLKHRPYRHELTFLFVDKDYRKKE